MLIYGFRFSFADEEFPDRLRCMLVAALLMLSSLGSFDLLNVMAASQDAGRQTDTQGKLKHL